MTHILVAAQQAMEATYETILQGGWTLSMADAECLYRIVSALHDLTEAMPDHPALSDIAHAIVALTRDGRLDVAAHAIVEASSDGKALVVRLTLSATSITLGFETQVRGFLDQGPSADPDLFVRLTPVGGFERRKLAQWADRLEAVAKSEHRHVIEAGFSR